MFVDRIYTEGLAQVAYVVGDEGSGATAVIDPRRDIDVYLDAAAARGVSISAILETHIHADFVSGARELSEETGVAVHCSAIGEYQFPHIPLHDGDEIPVGALRLRALHTPGHTPEHLSYLLFDTASGNSPQALFSGDMLFVGEVGRPDLLGESQTNILVQQLYESIFNRLLPLPDDLVVYPGHGAGSACGRSIGSTPTTTLGQEKRFNYAFQTRDRDEFERVILGDLPPAPTYYPRMKQLNRIGPTLLRDLRDGQPLDPEFVALRMAEGAVVIDTRSPEAFAAGHLPGALSIGLTGDFPVWCGWLAPYDHDIVLVLDHPAEFSSARGDLRRIGLDRIAGYLAGGVEAWADRGYDVATMQTAFPQAVYDRLQRGERIQVLDVRTGAEWNRSHIEGALHCFAGLLAQDPNRASIEGPTAVICGSGYRSSFAASVLQGGGRQELLNVLGGMASWEAGGFPVMR